MPVLGDRKKHEDLQWYYSCFKIPSSQCTPLLSARAGREVPPTVLCHLLEHGLARVLEVQVNMIQVKVEVKADMVISVMDWFEARVAM